MLSEHLTFCKRCRDLLANVAELKQSAEAIGIILTPALILEGWPIEL